MNLFVTLDRNYLYPLSVLLTSVFINNPDERFDVYLASDDLTDALLEPIAQQCARAHSRLHLITVQDHLFTDAPAHAYYSKAMYYRLLAGEILPQSLDRVLYLDPDMLVINALRPLYETPLDDHLYAACIHKGLINISKPVNQIRLSTYESEGYYNSGMLLMNLELIRREVSQRDIFEYVEKKKQLLVLPDQDVLNGLYGEQILHVDESLYNYDARKYREYRLASSSQKDMDWVMRHTAILHFCGRRKPWHKTYSGRFSSLYKHYMQLTERAAHGKIK